MTIPPAESLPVVIYPLAEGGKAGAAPRGTVTLSQRGRDALVTIDVAGLRAVEAPRVAAIFWGDCQRPGPRHRARHDVVHRLSPVVHGFSQTLLKRVSLRVLNASGYSLAVGGAPWLCTPLNLASRYVSAGDAAGAVGEGNDGTLRTAGNIAPTDRRNVTTFGAARDPKPTIS